MVSDTELYYTVVYPQWHSEKAAEKEAQITFEWAVALCIPYIQ
jgi:hypothetical protein